MSNFEDILERARNYLTSGWPSGKSTGRASSRSCPELVYDHSLRVWELAKLLVRDPAISESKLDHQVLAVCALFHDAGWVDQVKAGKIQPSEVYTRPTDAALYKRSVQIVCEQVGKLLSERCLEKVVEAISEMKSSRPALSETVLAADADNLEDFGLTGLTFQVRAAQFVGKSTSQVLESWHRQQEYHYWESRIKNALFLEMSKKIAQRRLEAMGQFFDLLRRETTLEDINLKELKETPYLVGG
jgi:HD superfamily phosphodiesterase